MPQPDIRKIFSLKKRFKLGINKVNKRFMAKLCINAVIYVYKSYKSHTLFQSYEDSWIKSSYYPENLNKFSHKLKTSWVY